MDRRQFIATTGATALAGSLVSMQAGAALLQSGSAAGQKRQDDRERQAVVDACNRCMKSGEACLAMCSEMLRHGMTALADCQARVVDMLAMCKTTGTMAALNTAPAARLKALAGLCADTCRDCATACKPQAATHPECKACMDDAAACAKACDAYKAARVA
jgi:Cys-rich four helix bundle protein (predicted Tat secretion target)